MRCREALLSRPTMSVGQALETRPRRGVTDRRLGRICRAIRVAHTCHTDAAGDVTRLPRCTVLGGCRAAHRAVSIRVAIRVVRAFARIPTSNTGALRRRAPRMRRVRAIRVIATGNALLGLGVAERRCAIRQALVRDGYARSAARRRTGLRATEREERSREQRPENANTRNTVQTASAIRMRRAGYHKRQRKNSAARMTVVS